MNEKLMNVIMKLEPLYEISSFKKAGDVVNDDLDIHFTNNRNVKLKDILKNGSVLFVFIKGTWCPFCRLHMQRLREWALKIKNSATIIVVSSESTAVINEWLKHNQFSYLFASDEYGILGVEFGVWIETLNFSQVSTFLVEDGGKVRASFVNRRDENLKAENFIG